jgi:hypothetical protein
MRARPRRDDLQATSTGTSTRYHAMVVLSLHPSVVKFTMAVALLLVPCRGDPLCVPSNIKAKLKNEQRHVAFCRNIGRLPRRCRLDLAWFGTLKTCVLRLLVHYRFTTTGQRIFSYDVHCLPRQRRPQQKKTHLLAFGRSSNLWL